MTPQKLVMPWQTATELMVREGLNQGELALLMGMTRTHANRIFSGRRLPTPQNEAVVVHLSHLFELVRAAKAMHQLVPTEKRRTKPWKRMKNALQTISQDLEDRHGWDPTRTPDSPSDPGRPSI